MTSIQSWIVLITENFNQYSKVTVNSLMFAGINVCVFGGQNHVHRD